MIKVKELRIGNFIKTELGIFPIKTIAFSEFMVSGVDGRALWATNVEPIELNEEWLLKLGFTKGTDLWGERAEYEYLFSEGKGVTVSDTNEIYMGCFSQTIKYVHQLQNLIFAMSGVELQLSST